MAIEEKLLLTIEAAQSAKTIKELEEGLKLARKALKEAELGSEDYNEILKATIELQKQHTNALRLGTKEVSAADSSYNALSRTLSVLKDEWKRLGEGIERTELGEKIKDVNNRLKELDATTGVYGRNVGNYERAALGFGNLQFQIQQVARELPSLSGGFNTFFLAISNNLPMLSDELARARAEIKLMKSEGQKVPSLFSVIAKSVFSWQTALVAIVTVLSLYGKDIVNWGKNLLSAAKNADAASKATEGLNKVLREGDDTLAAQIVSIRSLQMQWGLLCGDLEKQKKFIEDNKSEFEELGISIQNVNDFENAFVNNTSDLIQSLKQRAKAAAAQGLAQETYKKALAEQIKVEEEIAKGRLSYVAQSTMDGGMALIPERREYTEAEKEAMMGSIRAIEAEAEAYLTLANSANTAADAILGKNGIEKDGGKKQDVKLLGIIDTTNQDEKSWLQEYENRLLEFETNVYDRRAELQALDDQYTSNSLNNIQKVVTAQIDAYNQEKRLEEAKKKLKKAAVSYGAQMADAAAQIAGENTMVGKALAVASATASTYLTAQQAYASQFLPIPDATSPARGKIAMAAAIMSGLANVKSILSVKTDGKSTSMPSVGAGTTMYTAAPAVIQQVPVMRSLTGAIEEDRLNRLVGSNEQIAVGTNQPVKAYVVQSELEGEQLYADTREKESSF